MMNLKKKKKIVPIEEVAFSREKTEEDRIFPEVE